MIISPRKVAFKPKKEYIHRIIKPASVVLEDDEFGEYLSNVFYCNPYCSSQKGSCEKNHEFFRYIEPKYHSLDHLTQDKVDLIFL